MVDNRASDAERDVEKERKSTDAGESASWEHGGRCSEYRLDLVGGGHRPTPVEWRTPSGPGPLMFQFEWSVDDESSVEEERDRRTVSKSNMYLES